MLTRLFHVNVIPVPLLEPRDYVRGDAASQHDDVTRDAGSKECEDCFQCKNSKNSREGVGSLRWPSWRSAGWLRRPAALPGPRGEDADKYCFFIQSLNYVLIKIIYVYL